jgi:hypothetical protein
VAVEDLACVAVVAMTAKTYNLHDKLLRLRARHLLPNTGTI